MKLSVLLHICMLILKFKILTKSHLVVLTLILGGVLELIISFGTNWKASLIASSFESLPEFYL